MKESNSEPQNQAKANSQEMTIEEAFQHGVSLYQHNKRSEAKAVFEEIHSQSKNNIAVLQVLAIIYEEEGAWKQALKNLDIALEIEPNNSSLLFDKAQFLVKYGFNKEALNIINQLLDIAPNNADLLNLKNQVNTTLSNKKNATKSSITPDKQTQKEIDETLKLAKQFKNQGNIQQAKMLYQAVLSISNKDANALLELARIQIDEEQFALAIQTLLRSYNPNNPEKDSLILLSHCEIKIEEYKQARIYARLGIERWPEDDIFYRLLLLSYERAGNWQEVSKYGKQFLDLFPENQDILYRYANASFIRLRGRHNFTAETFLACEQLLNKAKKNANSNEKLLFSTYLAEISWFKGEANKAKAILEAYLKDHPENLEAVFNMSFIYRTLGDWDNYYKSYEVGIEAGKRLHYQGNLPRWDLSRPKDDIVLVLPEQGVGDEIFYCHNLNLVIENAKKVYVICDLRLEKMLSQSFPLAHVIPIARKHHQQMDIPKSVLKEINSWILGGSIAKVCYENLNKHIYQIPFHTPSQTVKTKIEKALSNLKQQYPNHQFIGLCWRSGTLAASRNIHYLNTEETAHLIKQFNNTVFINLQYGDCAKELKKIEKLSKIKIHQIDGIDLKDDFESTAALISCMDKVITAVTAIQRLTSAVGIESHVFYAGTEDADYQHRVPLMWQKEFGYIYPPMLDNKYPMLESMASQIQSQ